MSTKVRKPKVSIGLPVRNGETYLCEALDAILCQTYSDFEIIAADNASTDSTLLILNDYSRRDRRLKVFCHSKNMGAAYNYNFVFAKSSGQYFKWAAHDDLMDSTFLEKTCSVLDANPSTVLVYPQTTIIDENGHFIKHDAEEAGSVENLINNTARRFHCQLRKNILYGNSIMGLLRSSALEKTGLIGEFVSSDLALLRNLALHGKIMKIKEPLFLRRVHPKTSVRANPSIEELHYWFTARKNDSTKLWFAQHVKYHVSGVAETELGIRTKIRCLFSIALWSCRKWDLFFADTYPETTQRLRSILQKIRKINRVL